VAAVASDGEAPLPQHAGQPGESARLQNTAPAAAQAPTSTSAERAAHYEQLAQRLGQALGQRLQAQIERGEWKVQMQVDPVSLGRIDMELDMRSGGLDAVFRSDNQLTRDLIAQGLPRLRETLAHSGTAVANVCVQSDAGRQGGGNPTPGRGRFAGAPGVKETPAPAQEAIQATRPRTGDDGAWDVLA